MYLLWLHQPKSSPRTKASQPWWYWRSLLGSNGVAKKPFFLHQCGIMLQVCQEALGHFGIELVPENDGGSPDGILRFYSWFGARFNTGHVFFLAVGNLHMWISPRTFHRKNMEKPLWPFMNQPAIWLSNTAGEYPEKNGHFWCGKWSW